MEKEKEKEVKPLQSKKKAKKDTKIITLEGSEKAIKAFLKYQKMWLKSNKIEVAE